MEHGSEVGMPTTRVVFDATREDGDICGQDGRDDYTWSSLIMETQSGIALDFLPKTDWSLNFNM